MAEPDRPQSPFAGMADLSVRTPVRVLSPDEIERLLAEHRLYLETGLPGTPSSSRTLPSSVTLRTKWPPSSVRNIVESGAIWTPCARGYCPSPQERKKLPWRSKTIIGCSPRLNT